MPSTIWLINRIQKEHPDLRFVTSNRFSWNPENSTVTYTEQYLPHKLLHEVAHGILDHRDYSRDIELLAMECAAWKKASELGKHYDVLIPEDAIEDALDTYRDWMHARSTCPICSSTGVQSSAMSYSCIACHTMWRVNEARTCELRRYKIEKISL